ncbi:hypothetical protein ANCCAN_28191 [Ancylostoma caninum]|uniref:Uncharacterized protein n=1 Tax=Ancylostoma caninum TaxID=29170 RepID=A0A368F510_ANCCA|nr:hypothetical protein ANCCAN_28191 [Ancylostoma caninum]
MLFCREKNVSRRTPSTLTKHNIVSVRSVVCSHFTCRGRIRIASVSCHTA